MATRILACLCGTLAFLGADLWGSESTPSPEDVGRQVWSIVEAIERHHAAVPNRRSLWMIITPELVGDVSREELEAISSEFNLCSTSDEFANRLVGHRSQKRDEQASLEVLVNTVIEKFSKHPQIGSVRLIRAKDHEVDEQFRNNRYVGLGVALGIDQESQCAQFPRVMPGGAAERGGVEPNTIVLEIDGQSTKGVPLQKILDTLRGPLGSEVTLKVAASGNRPEREVTLTRGFVRIDSVYTHDRAPVSRGSLRWNAREPIGWLAVPQLTGSTLHELRSAEVRLRAEGNRAVILDFQNSERSDDFHQAQLVADGLIDGGTLWNRHARDEEPQAVVADRECLFRGMPLVIVVNEYTGPAHAAVAAALQDAGRAVLVGQSPPFEGVISSAVSLPDSRHVLWMNTAKLTRSRTDRSWPLKPDQIAGPVRQFAMTKDGQRVPVAAPAVMKNRQVTVNDWWKVLGIDDGAVSALFPSNLTQHEIALRQREFYLQMLRQGHPMPGGTISPEMPQPAAHRIANELLKKAAANS